MSDIFHAIAERQTAFESFVKGSGDRLYVPSQFNYAHVLGKDVLGYTDQNSTVVSDQIDQRKMAVPCKITTIAQDRDGDVVVPEGCRDTLDQYAINAQVLFGHGSEPFPVGKAKEHRDAPLRVEIFPDYVLSWCYFNCRTKASEETFHLVVNGDINMASIGFAPIEAERLRPVKAHHNGPGVPPGWLFKLWTLFEWSWVVIPSNPFAEAVRRYISRGYITGDGPMSSVMKSALAPYAEKAKVYAQGADIGGGRDHFTVDKRWEEYAKKFEQPEEDPPQWSKAQGRYGSKFGGQSIADEIGYVHEGEDLDVTNRRLPPSAIIYNWVSRYFECQIKDVFQNGTSVPAARLGSFLVGLEMVIGKDHKEDCRNIKGDGSESPPVFDVVQLNSKSKRDFLIEGTSFYRGEKCKYVIQVHPSWAGLSLTIYTHEKDRKFNQDLIDNAWSWAKANNFLKGEAFSLGGDFLDRTEEGWDDVFLEERNKVSLKRIITQINQKGNAFANRGVIMTGPPGTGKTLSGRIIRNTAAATFIWVSSRDFHKAGSFGGIAFSFELAKELAPAVLFIEDVDNWLDNYTVDLVKTEMDGISRSKGVLTFLTTNYPERLPQALIDRPGRFHDVLQFALPDEKARREMIKKWMKDLPNVAVGEAVSKTVGYSGAHVYELAHFAKTLQEQDGLSPTDALQHALTKIAEQRDLIDQIQLNGSNYESPRLRRREGSDAVSKKWSKGAARRKEPMTESVGADGGNLVEDKSSPNQDVQCVYVPKKVAATVDEAKKWLETHSFTADNVVDGGKDESDFWKAEQFPKKDCTGDLVEEELADGAKGFLCKPKNIEKPEAPEESTKRVYSIVEKTGDYERHVSFATHGEMMSYLETKCGGKPCDCNDGGKTMGANAKISAKPGKKTRKEMDEEKDEELVSNDDATVKDEELVSDDDATVKDEELASDDDGTMKGVLPHGAEMTRDVAEHFTLLKNYLDKMLPLLEEEDMRDFFGGELVEACEGVLERLSELAREKYAEHKDEFGEHLKMEGPAANDDEELVDDLENADDSNSGQPAGDEEEMKDDGFSADSDAADDDSEVEDDDNEDPEAAEEEDEEEAMSAKGREALAKLAKKGRRAMLAKRMNKRTKNIVKEAVEHLEHAASHDFGDIDEKTHKMMKGAHLYHAGQLKSMMDDVVRDPVQGASSEGFDDGGGDTTVKDEELVSDDDATVGTEVKDDGDEDDLSPEEAKALEATISELEREVQRNAAR